MLHSSSELRFKLLSFQLCPPFAMAEQDPLVLLRTAITSNEPPKLLTAAQEATESFHDAASLSFTSASVTLAKDTPTRYTAKANSTTGFYNVGQLYLAWLERQAPLREYMMKAQGSGVGYVTTLDRRGVVEYLTGVSDGAGRVIDVGAAGTTSPTAPVPSSLPQAGQHDSQQASTSTSAAALSQAPKRRYEPNVADREICKKIRASEVELVSRSAVLRTCGGGKENNFASIILPIAVEKIKAMRASQSSSSSRQPAPTPAASSSSEPRARKAKQGHPIIMISSSPTALITMWNVKKFLEQGIFESSDVARANEAAQGNTRVEDVLPIYRKRGGEEKPVKYFVVEGVEALQKFGQDAWDRVVCVLTTGQTWQFQAYKWHEPKQLFRHVTGVYFQWNNEPANPNVKEWNVTELRIDRQRRHVDKQIVGSFWRVLDGGKVR